MQKYAKYNFLTYSDIFEACYKKYANSIQFQPGSLHKLVTYKFLLYAYQQEMFYEFFSTFLSINFKILLSDFRKSITINLNT